MIEVQQYVDPAGHNPFQAWAGKLDSTTGARVATAIARVETGNPAGAKSVGTGVQELRLNFGPGYRIYFGRVGDLLVLLLGGRTKSRQQADIERAQALWQEYKSRKRED